MAIGVEAEKELGAPRPGPVPEMEGLLAEVLASLDEGVLVTRRDGAILYANGAAAKLTGYGPDRLGQERLEHVLAPVDAAQAAEVQRRLRAGEPLRAVALCRARDGRTYWASLRLSPMRGGAGDVDRVVACVRDVTRGKGRYETWRRLALVDDLTGIANRRHFLAVAERHAADARAGRRPLSLAAFDVDHFKRLNDAYGHECGDVVLQQIVARCTSVLRKPDWIGRIGGEEFAIILPQTPLGDAAAVVARLREAIAARPFVFSGRSARVTASFGVTALDLASGESVPSCLKRADDALYRAKGRGRNALCMLPPPGSGAGGGMPAGHGPGTAAEEEESLHRRQA